MFGEVVSFGYVVWWEIDWLEDGINLMFLRFDFLKVEVNGCVNNFSDMVN